MSARAYGLASLVLFGIGLWAVVYIDDAFVRFMVAIPAIQGAWACEIYSSLLTGRLRKGEL